MTIGELRRDGALKLRLGDIETPILDANILLANACNIDRHRLIVDSSEKATEAQIGLFYSMISRRLEGECVAYIIGEKEFMGLTFKVSKDVLVPRPETEILVDRAIAWIDAIGNGDCSVLDLCTGTGCVAVAIKSERPDCGITASDISAEALLIAQENAERNLGSGQSKSYPQPISFVESDLFQHIHGRFTIIASNPPYIPTAQMAELRKEVLCEPRLALDGGPDGLLLIRKIIEGARSRLEPGGRLLIEADPGQTPQIVGLLGSNKYDNILVHKDLAGNDRVFDACCETGAEANG